LAELHRREARQADQNAAQAKSEEQRQSDGAGSGMDTANGR
jgi:hypothetical protein